MKNSKKIAVPLLWNLSRVHVAILCHEFINHIPSFYCTMFEQDHMLINKCTCKSGWTYNVCIHTYLHVQNLSSVTLYVLKHEMKVVVKQCCMFKLLIHELRGGYTIDIHVPHWVHGSII